MSGRQSLLLGLTRGTTRKKLKSKEKLQLCLNTDGPLYIQKQHTLPSVICCSLTWSPWHSHSSLCL